MNTFLENCDIIQGIGPVDLQTGANTGARINMTEYDRCLVVLTKAIGTDDQDPVLAVKQHTAASSGNSKALQTYRYWHKLGTATTWTRVDAAAADTITIADSAQKAGLIAIEVRAEDMDAQNSDPTTNYKYLSLDIADVGGNAQLGATVYIPFNKRQPGVVTDPTV